MKKLELKAEKEKLDRIKVWKSLFSGVKTTRLTELKQETYVVKAAKRVNTYYGEQYKLLIGEENNRLIVWSNKTIRDKLYEAEDGKIVDEDGTF